MLFRLVCACGATARAEANTNYCPPWLSPIAMAIRAVCRKMGWRFYGERVGKSVVTAKCAGCVHRDGAGLYMDGDLVPQEISPGTYAQDLALWESVDTPEEAA